MGDNSGALSKRNSYLLLNIKGKIDPLRSIPVASNYQSLLREVSALLESKQDQEKNIAETILDWDFQKTNNIKNIIFVLFDHNNNN